MIIRYFLSATFLKPMPFTAHPIRLRVLDIHRYSPSRADWGKRFFFCPVISKAHPIAVSPQVFGPKTNPLIDAGVYTSHGFIEGVCVEAPLGNP